MHLPTFKWTSSFLYEIITRKKRYTNILLLQPNDKYKVVKRKPAVRNYWVRPGKDRYWWENFTSRKVVEEEWRENFRMSRETFQVLCAELYPYIFKNDARFRNAVPVGKQVAGLCTICFDFVAISSPHHLGHLRRCSN